MLQRTKYFIVVWLLTSSVTIFGQENPQNVGKKLIGNKEIIQSSLQGLLLRERLVFKKDHTSQTFYVPITMVVNECFTGPLYQTTYVPFRLNYTQQISWTCLKELQIENATHIPLRLRLGSLNYVDWLEQKPNSKSLY